MSNPERSFDDSMFHAEKVAEVVAAKVYEDLKQWCSGEKSRFTANFPVGATGENGIALQAIAQRNFEEMVGIVNEGELNDTIIALTDEHKLYRRIGVYESGEVWNVGYSSDEGSFMGGLAIPSAGV